MDNYIPLFKLNSVQKATIKYFQKNKKICCKCGKDSKQLFHYSKSNCFLKIEKISNLIGNNYSTNRLNKYYCSKCNFYY